VLSTTLLPGREIFFALHFAGEKTEFKRSWLEFIF
jgi:hypothetical protein